MNFSTNSSSLNNTTSLGGPQSICFDTSFQSKASIIGRIFSLSVITIVSLIGNILIIFVVYNNQNLRRTINFFIVNIAVSDLIIPTFVLPKLIVDLWRGDTSWLLEGMFGRIACKLIFFLSDISQTVSILSLIFMTIDRFLAVVYPLRVTLMNSKRRYCLIALTWIISAAFFTPYFYAMDVYKFGNGKNVCVLLWSPKPQKHIAILTAFSGAISILFLLLPFCILTVLYSIILMKTRQTPDLIRNKTCLKARLRQRQTARRVTLMAFLIVFIFGICWGPFNVTLFMLNFVWGWRKPAGFCKFPTFFFAVQFLCYSNAAINPCVYFILIKNFRKGLKNQWSKGRRSKQQYPLKSIQTESLIASTQTTVKNTNCSSAETCM